MRSKDALLIFFIANIALFGVANSSEILRDGDPLCANDPPFEVVPHPHEANCSLYWECFNEEKTLNSCPNGLWYNERLQSYDFPENSECTNRPEHQCENVDLDYLPDPNDCSKYIECFNGNAYEMSCPPGYYFSIVSKRCVLPQYAICGTTTWEPPTSTNPPWTTPDPVCWGVHPGQIVLKPYPGDCRKYYECIGASLTVLTCPKGLYFNEVTQSCDFPALVNCDDHTTTEPPSTTEGPTISTTTSEPHTDNPICANEDLSYWPVPTTCTDYIECYDGSTYLMHCPSGLYFNNETKTCVDPSESDCGKTPPPTINPTDTTTWPTGFTPDPDCPFPAHPDDQYLFPFEGDCTKYWECEEGIKIVRNCPEDLYFNPVLLICDYPYEAGCEWAKLLERYRK